MVIKGQQLLTRDLITVFLAGMAWGSLMLSVRGVKNDVAAMHARIAAVETYMIAESHGKFIPQAEVLAGEKQEQKELNQ